jgi:hypothetical protein
MAKHSHVEALAAIERRIAELQTRRERSKYAGDFEKVESLNKKLALAMGRAARLRRKEKCRLGA